MDPFAVVGEQLTESLPQRTASAPARAVLGVLAASWAGMPETGWPGAGSTQRFGQGPAAYESNLTRRDPDRTSVCYLHPASQFLAYLPRMRRAHPTPHAPVRALFVAAATR